MQVYVYLGGEVVGIVDDRQNFYALYNDHLGRPYEAYRLSDNKLGWSAENSAFGRVFEHHNPAAPLLGVQIGLPGQYLDQISGLWYNWHRHYDQALGRYVQSDPIGLGGGINTYAYVGGDPLNFVDPMGLSKCGCESGGSESGRLVDVNIGYGPLTPSQAQSWNKQRASEVNRNQTSTGVIVLVGGAAVGKVFGFIPGVVVSGLGLYGTHVYGEANAQSRTHEPGESKYSVTYEHQGHLTTYTYLVNRQTGQNVIESGRSNRDCSSTDGVFDKR